MWRLQHASHGRTESTGVSRHREEDGTPRNQARARAAETRAVRVKNRSNKIFCSGEGPDGATHFLAGARMHNNFMPDDHMVRSTYTWTELKTATFVANGTEAEGHRIHFADAETEFQVSAFAVCGKCESVMRVAR